MRGQLPLRDLPAWCRLNNIAFNDVTVADIEGRGLGLIAEATINNENNELPALLTIPKDHVLSAAKIEDYAKENKDFCELLDAAGHQVGRPTSYRLPNKLISLEPFSHLGETSYCFY
jgi:hypothetical protein